jgi:Mg2+ and Co2+ transporter CorA
MIYAQLPTIQWSTTGEWLIGAVAVLAGSNLLFSTINAVKKLFARHASIDEQLATIYSDFKKEINAVSQKCEARHEVVQNSMDKKLSELHEKINTVASDVAYIRGMISKSDKR